MIIEKNKVLQTTRPIWYYSKPEKERKNITKPDGGFLKENETIIFCSLDMTFDGAVKAKVLHGEKNVIYLVYQSGDESYFFKELNTCN